MTDFVMLPVPTDRVSEVYALLSTPGAAATPQAPSSGVGESPYILFPWSEEKDIRRFYRESSPNMKDFLHQLASRHPNPVTSIEAGMLLPKGAESVAGMLGAAGRRAKNRHGCGLPWASWGQVTEDGTGTETVFCMDEKIATWILDFEEENEAAAA